MSARLPGPVTTFVVTLAVYPLVLIVGCVMIARMKLQERRR